MNYDILIKNGKIIDGTGNPWYYGDIGIQREKIAEIGHLKNGESENLVDASGLIVSPGFIDSHSHADSVSLVFGEMSNLIHQGITTVIAGQCGSSLAPISDSIREYTQNQLNKRLPDEIKLELTWTTFDEYLTLEEKKSISLNIAHLVGHGAIRASSMGREARKPTKNEMETMKNLVHEAMKAGAFGFSTGLIYPPGIYAKTKEIIELAKIASKYGGIYDTHIRGEGKTLMKSLKEALLIGEKANIPVQISHHKIASKLLWGKSTESLKMFEEARENGVDVTIDQYPYKAGATSLLTLLPPWVHDGGSESALERLTDPELRERMKNEIEEGLKGWENFAGELGWENVYVTSVKTPDNKGLEGKNLVEIKKIRDEKDEFTSLYKLLLEEKGTPGMIIFYGSDEDIDRIMKHPLHMVGTDAGGCSVEGPFFRGKPHPRHYGTYPRILGRYVRDNKLLSWEEAIRKMTSFPAQRFGIKNRGILKPGMYADVVLFNPKTITDNSTYVNPHRYPTGIQHVIINGKITIGNSKYTNILNGKTLRKTTE